MTGDEGRVSVVFAKLPPKTPYWDQVLEVDFIRFGVGFFFSFLTMVLMYM